MCWFALSWPLFLGGLLLLLLIIAAIRIALLIVVLLLLLGLLLLLINNGSKRFSNCSGRLFWYSLNESRNTLEVPVIILWRIGWRGIVLLLLFLRLSIRWRILITIVSGFCHFGDLTLSKAGRHALWLPWDRALGVRWAGTARSLSRARLP